MQQRLASQHRHEVTEDGHTDIIACCVLTSLGRQSTSLLVTFCVPARCVGNDWEEGMIPVTLTALAGSFHDDNSQDHCAEEDVGNGLGAMARGSMWQEHVGNKQAQEHRASG